ncbi:MAG: superoxide dismutase [Proteobacteria bacterium]|nr:superoxide dismutase [Pseudomonadota bacterium]
MSFELPPLPYSRHALAPVISEKTMGFHYDKHHQAYVTKLNELIKGQPEENKKLEEIIKLTHDDAKHSIFNNAAQTWNHSFFRKSMKKGAAKKIPPELEKRLKETFGSPEKFKEEFAAHGVT